MTQEESVLVSGHVVRHLALMDYALKRLYYAMLWEALLCSTQKPIMPGICPQYAYE